MENTQKEGEQNGLTTPRFQSTIDGHSATPLEFRTLENDGRARGSFSRGHFTNT